MKEKKFVTEIIAKTAARSGAVLVLDEDEFRVQAKVYQASLQMGYSCWIWKTSTGLVPVGSVQIEKSTLQQFETVRDPSGLLQLLAKWTYGPSMVLAYDLASLIAAVPAKALLARQIKDLASQQQSETDPTKVAQLVVCDTQDPDIACGFQRVSLPLPDRTETGIILDAVIDVLEGEPKETAQQQRERLLNALAGLPAYQIEAVLAESRVRRDGYLDPDFVREYKRQLVTAKGLTWVDPDPRGFEAIGGLEPFKSWVRTIAPAFDANLAKEYGIEPPKGCLAFGVPGCAKSAIVKAMAQELGFALVRLDMGQTRGKYQGESEAGLEAAIKTAEAVAPCILHIDEVEKSLAGGVGSGDADGGTSGRILQYLLTWLQERTAPVFIYMTANRPDLLPPELLRAGRLDAQWWFDLPTASERAGIVEVFKKKFNKAASVDTEKIEAASERNNGAEIEAAFREALLTALADRREVTTEDVLAKLASMSKVADSFKVDGDLAVLKDQARQANNPETVEGKQVMPTVRIRNIDF